VASQWRLRHKLLLGLGLVVGVISLLLLGTLEALSSYAGTMNSISSKLSELKKAEELSQAVSKLTQPPEAVSRPQDEVDKLQANVHKVEECLTGYQGQLQETLDQHRDPARSYDEQRLTEDLQQGLSHFRQAVQFAQRSRVIDGPPLHLAEDRGIRDAHRKLIDVSDELRQAIVGNVWNRIAAAKHHQRRSLIIVVSASLLGATLMASLLYFFYGWVFFPIKSLQEGVGRVARGDFDHPIKLRSGDELQELADAFNDMTSRLQATYRDMARQINERSRQLVRSERLVSVGFLAAGVAHEINNPLASITFCAEALEQRIAGLLAQRPDEGDVISKYLKMIQRESFRCKEITQQLLQFSRGGDKREPAELGELVKRVLEIAQHLDVFKGKRVVFQPATTLTAIVNAQEVTQVILNLVVNALESMGEGGTLVITLSRRGESAELVFIDTGSGMTAEVLENIFEPFFTTKSTGRGTGLGLSISHLIIAQHGGEVTAASAGTNEGSTFTVRLPLEPVLSAESRVLSQTADAQGPSGTPHAELGTSSEEGYGHAAA
jgi:signal transduction histidine kinase